jgi:5-methylthioribose kinase
MYELTAQNAADYLRASGRVAPGENVAVRSLPGGISNVVLLVTPTQQVEPFVLKQARGRLNVETEWLSSIDRVWREVEVLRLCDTLIGTGAQKLPASGVPPAATILARYEPRVPRVLWEDRDNYLFAMTSAPRGHRTWKELLLHGEARQGISIATTCGQLLARLHARSWKNPTISRQLDDRTFFDELRIDPYYRHIAGQHPELAAAVERLIDSVWQNRLCLVHGDFSPKNLLVWGGGMMLIDFEVGHYGDPAFDLGFFLTHLVLKGLWAGSHGDEYLRLATTFWNTYQHQFDCAALRHELAGLEHRAMFNLAGCLLARVAGKSRVEYLSQDQREMVRRVAAVWLKTPPPTWNAMMEELAACGWSK